MFVRSDALRIPLADASVDLVVGSPPYGPQRTYGIGAQRGIRAWIDWMLDVTTEALRVSRGLVLWVVAGWTEDWNYQPGPEGLLWKWWDRGGECHCLRPAYWHRYGISGSGGKQWYRADVEYVLAFKRPGPLPYGDPLANGHPPKFGPGGRVTHRLVNGERKAYVLGRGRGGRRENGKGRGNEPWSESTGYAVPEIANPGNLLSTGAAGGGNLGHPLAHENEAPYPVEVPKFFIASHCRPAGLVLDPFCGSSTTGQAAMELGRRYIGADLRQSQLVLSRRRMATITPALDGMFDLEPTGGPAS